MTLDRVDDKRDSAVAIASRLRNIPVGKDIIVTTPDEIALEQQFPGSLIEIAVREGRVIFDRGSSGAQDTDLAALRAG